MKSVPPSTGMLLGACVILYWTSGNDVNGVSEGDELRPNAVIVNGYTFMRQPMMNRGRSNLEVSVSAAIHRRDVRRWRAIPPEHVSRSAVLCEPA
jgi:hypothetical protein